MNPSSLLISFQKLPYLKFIIDKVEKKAQNHFYIKGFSGSADSVASAAFFAALAHTQLCILPSEEEATAFYRDVSGFLDAKKLIFFPSLWHKGPTRLQFQKDHQVQRTEALNILKKNPANKFIITWPDALSEWVAAEESLGENTLQIQKGDRFDLDFGIEFLNGYNFERSDFVFEPGQFSLRGGIVDIFSFGHDQPVRIQLNEQDKVSSIRLFDPQSQLSEKNLSSVTLVPDMENSDSEIRRIPFTHYLPENTWLWIREAASLPERLKMHIDDLQNVGETDPESPKPSGIATSSGDVIASLAGFSVIETGYASTGKETKVLEAHTSPEPLFDKNFPMLAGHLKDNSRQNIQNLVFSDSPAQVERLYAIFEDLDKEVSFTPLYIPLTEGFAEKDLKVALFSEHNLFKRLHKRVHKKKYSREQAMTLQDLTRLQPGDFVTHIDHGIGQFSGLEKINIKGHQQEAVRLIYRDNDLLYVSIHSLHKISRYSGKDGNPPKLHKLGSEQWQKAKSRTRKKVKDIARDLIKLYAARKASTGYAFPPDNYLQVELEASFLYEDTPDQARATEDVKQDMEAGYPMDRLICGDVGFGKTEVAVRAAFKAVNGNKQVAVLVPTTILALQHYKTFTERLEGLPCNVDYINRFKSKKEQTQTLKKLAERKTDIIIGTHRLLGKDIKFHDLGLLIIDEEQKFGVVAKEKIRSLKTTVDTLTLTATPIPRTLNFAMMGSRDLSLINTPPPNRQSIETIADTFNAETIGKALTREIERNGQVYFVHNRIKDIHQIAEYVRQIVPEAKIAVAHGQMDGKVLEEIMFNFVEGYYDILISTAIVESGLDIPNANTMIINNAQNFGLSDLYQLRGRVGRSRVKGYCYLLAPPLSTLTDDARKRLKAISEFTDLGSGFHVAMRDMDIRGAGNLLGSEQSGFINEVGYETYQQILKDAVQELKAEEFSELFKDDPAIPARADTHIDTDLEIMIPDAYVSDTNERLALYKELNTLMREKELEKFAAKLEDRFGPLPDPVQQLIDSVRLRWLAGDFFIRKITLKDQNMKAFFATGSPAEQFFQSDAFGTFLSFVQQFPQKCRFVHKKDRIILHVKSIQSVGEALTFFRPLPEKQATIPERKS